MGVLVLSARDSVTLVSVRKQELGILRGWLNDVL